MKPKRIKLLSTISLVLSSSLATAGTMGAVAPAVPFGELSFSVGYFDARAGKEQHIDIETLVGNDYTVDKKSDDNYLLGLGYLIHGRDFNSFSLDYGVKAFYLAQTHVEGVIVQEDIFTNLSYRYSVTHVPIYAMARATLKRPSSNYALTLDAGIGPNIMRTHSYFENSLDGGITIPDNAFFGHTNTEFSATVGAGIKLNNLISSASIELGYRFFYLGQGEFRTNNSQILTSLKTNDCYAHAVVLTISI
ncbi:MAG: hypothetical protein H0U73_11225 [Tatlockia sp.]|nr:hypothetical protein [Tatlockia sp.]